MNPKIKRIIKNFVIPVPRKIKNNFVSVSNDAMCEIETQLCKNYFSRFPEGYLQTKAGVDDLMDHKLRRLENTRYSIVPWLFSLRHLGNSSILEIGCGTGTSLIPFAEQEAIVTGIDIDEGCLKVAESRAKLYGQKINLIHANAQNSIDLLRKNKFDFVIFYACLEHMTYNERIATLSEYWNKLSVGSYLVIVETPNRLWYYDSHTWFMPFMNWLPDELAYDYSSKSHRSPLNNLFKRTDKEKQLESLYRFGRGASFHEFEVAIGDLIHSNIASRLHAFNRKRSLCYWIKWRFSQERKYHKFLKKISKNIDPCFFEEYLEFALKKS